MPALPKCQEALPLHACTCARVHGHGEIKVQQEPGGRLEHVGGAAAQIFDVSDQRSRAFVPWRLQTGCMLGLICGSKSRAAGEVRVAVPEEQICGFVESISKSRVR